MLFMKANPFGGRSPKEMELVSPLNVLSEELHILSDELRGGTALQSTPRRKPSRRSFVTESVHGKIIDAESSRVQLFAEVVW
jgi:hypothetical protein